MTLPARLIRRCIPLWVYRHVVPYRITRWLFRKELARGAEYAREIGWTD